MTTPAEPRRPDSGRPSDLSPQQLGFVRQKPVSWLSPTQLAGTAVRVLGLKFFGAYLDKRELQGALPDKTFDHTGADSAALGDDTSADFWLDYIGDLGDGFDATYSMAWLLAQPHVDISEESGTVTELPRGAVLVLGGDQVYPTPSHSAYLNRFHGPYHAALPQRPDRPPMLYALPGNHDWYDGLTAFLRVFARDSWIGGWRTQQTRSYFAVRLPHQWWLYAVDTQLSAYIDAPQIEYFTRAAAHLRPGDRVILCVPQPAWVETEDDPGAYDSTDVFIRRIIEPTGATTSVLLAGDLHHYTRYERAASASDAADRAGAEPEAPAHLVTCGGGGAFLAGTATLPETLEVPSPKSISRDSGPATDYRLAARFPSQEKSRAYAWKVLGNLLRRNPGFAAVVGVLHLVLLMALEASREQFITPASVAMTIVVLAGTVALAGSTQGPISGPRFLRRTGGVLHGLAHLGLGVGGTALWLATPFPHLWAPLEILLAAAIYAPTLALVGTELVAVYFLIASKFGINLNELFASQSIEDSKAFLRMRFSADGALTIFPIAVDHVCHSWRATPDDPPDRPWIAPEQYPQIRLAESPIRIERQPHQGSGPA